jgi:hypothetical protein
VIGGRLANTATMKDTTNPTERVTIILSFGDSSARNHAQTTITITMSNQSLTLKYYIVEYDKIKNNLSESQNFVHFGAIILSSMNRE